MFVSDIAGRSGLICLASGNRARSKYSTAMSIFEGVLSSKRFWIRSTGISRCWMCVIKRVIKRTRRGESCASTEPLSSISARRRQPDT